MFTTICLGWIGYQLSAPLWYFVLAAIRLFFNGYELCNDPTLIYNDCGEIELVTIFDDDTIQRRKLSDCLNWYYK